jgi:hypothetical protein
VTLSLVSSFGFARAEPEQMWLFVSEDQARYRLDHSLEAQHGTQLAVIDGTVLTQPIEYQKKAPYWQSPFSPSGFIYQTIKAAPYVTKHLHVSGFARGVKPNVG